MAKELLSDVTVRNAKPNDKDRRLNDGGGLYLLIKPNGAKWWRFDYSIDGKRKTLSLGVYPAISLADARRKASEAKNQQANGINPSDTRKETKKQQRLIIENEKRIDDGLPAVGSFKDVALQWYDKIEAIKPLTGNGRFVFPSARTPNGSRAMSDVALLAGLRRMGFDKTEMSVHGFRAMARTILDEVRGFRPDFIEHHTPTQLETQTDVPITVLHIYPNVIR